MDVEASKTKRGAGLPKIGRAIREWRESEVGGKTVSMEELAVKIERSLSTIQRWERGVLQPKVSDLQKMDKVKPGLLERLFPRLAAA